MSKNETTPPENGAGFLNRWSARKRQETSVKQSVAIEQAPESANPLNATLESDPASAAPLATGDETRSDDAAVGDLGANENITDGNLVDSVDEQEPALLSDEDMPALETLTAKSDMSDFFNKGVSDAVRRAAFRHVFSLPVYNIRDGLNDYDDDYTKFEPLGDTITSDMKWHKARKEREAAEAEERRLLAEREAEEEARALEDQEIETEQESLESEESQEAIDDDADGDEASDTDSVSDGGVTEEDDGNEGRKDDGTHNSIHSSNTEPETTA